MWSRLIGIDLSHHMRFIADIDDLEHSSIGQRDGAHHGLPPNGKEDFAIVLLTFDMTDPRLMVIYFFDAVEFGGNRGIVEEFDGKCIGVDCIEIDRYAPAAAFDGFNWSLGLRGQGQVRVAE